MLVIAHHHISNPEGFWAKAQEVTKNLPASLKVLCIYPATDGRAGTCIWRANSAQDVQQFLDEYVGQLSKNYCYELDVEKSVGLPALHLSEAQLA